MTTIVVIEDERSIADSILHSIEREGWRAVWRDRGLEGLEYIRAALRDPGALQTVGGGRESNGGRETGGGCDLVVLDVGLPDIGGFELCKAIRAFSGVPIIFLTARDDEIDKIVGLEIGGDDYITKPFSPRELAARIRTILRRLAGPAGAIGPAGFAGSAGQAGSERLTAPPLRIDREKRQAVYHGVRLELTRYEFGLLALLAERPGRVFSREALMRAVWDDDSPSLDRTVDAHVKSLRAKFREIAPPDPILTHRGTGYALRDDLKPPALGEPAHGKGKEEA